MRNTFWKRIGIGSAIVLACASLLYASQRHRSGGGGGDGGGGFRRSNQGHSSSIRHSGGGAVHTRTDARRNKDSSMHASGSSQRRAQRQNRSSKSSSKSSRNRKSKQSKREKRQRKSKSKSKSKKSKRSKSKKQKSKSKKTKSRKSKAQKQKDKAAKRAQKALSKKSGKTVTASAQTSKTLASRRGATAAALRANPTARGLRTALAVGVVGGTAGVVIGSRFYARGAFSWRPGLAFSFGFWGTPWCFGPFSSFLFFRPFGCWFWPSWRWWYFPWSACWYYPGCWYYPYLGCSIYLTSERERIYIVENDSDNELYAAVYYRKPLDNDEGYYLYRVDEPIEVTGKNTIKIRAPKNKKKEYVILTDKDKNKLGISMIQDIDGSLIQPEEGDEQAYPKDSSKDKIKVQKLSKNDEAALSKMKEESDLGKAKSELSNKANDLKDFDAEAEIERNKDNKDAARNLTEQEAQQMLEGKPAAGAENKPAEDKQPAEEKPQEEKPEDLSDQEESNDEE